MRSPYVAIFVNRENDHHERLINELGPLIDSEKVIPILGTAADLLESLKDMLTDQTVFLYIDPFGLRGCEFETLKPFLARDKNFSTEIIINISVPTLHRLAARKAVAAQKREDARIMRFHDRLSAVLGGDYWQYYLWDEAKDAESRAADVISAYREKMQEAGATFTGSCPVRHTEDSSLKYFITFSSRHQDAMLLMNDIMCKAYHEGTHEALSSGTLFEKSGWRDGRDCRNLQCIIERAVERMEGARRIEIWLEIIQHCFMVYLSSEYKEAVKKLCHEGRLRFTDVRGTGRLNDDSRLYPV